METFKSILEASSNFILSARDYLELIYFIAGAIVAFCAIRALSQLKLMKYDIESRSKRDSLLVTNELILDINSNIFNKLGAIAATYETIRTDGFKYDDIDFANPTAQQKEDATKVFERLESDVVELIIAVLSLLETFAFKILNGLAIETIVFKSAGIQYCRIIQFLTPCIISLRDYHIHQSQSYIIELYNNWSSKITKEVLDEEQTKLIDELKTIKDKSKELNIKEIDTIGTKPQI